MVGGSGKGCVQNDGDDAVEDCEESEEERKGRGR